MVRQRDAEVREFMDSGSIAGADKHTPATATMGVDGGRSQVRAEDAGRGVHDPRWVEPRYAAFRSYRTEVHASDPHPDVPKAFLDRKHVEALTDEIHRLHKRTPQENAEPAPSTDTDAASTDNGTAAGTHSSAPKPLLQTCVAAFATADDFGHMLAAEAERRGFYRCRRQAFLGDGGTSNWTIHELHFPDATPILDFIHLLTYLFAAAAAARRTQRTAWDLYVRLVTAAWRGEISLLTRILERESSTIGHPPPKAADSDPRKIVAAALSYVRNNGSRMDYPTYRTLGFPITTCHVESLVKQFNFRVKASDKFWTPPCLDAILQVRAARLSGDARWQRFWDQRPDFLARNTRTYRARAA